MSVEDANVRFPTGGRRRHALAVACAAALLGTGAVGCGGDDDGDRRDLPDGAVAVVGDDTISERELDVEVANLKRAQSDRGAGAGVEQLREQALAIMLQRKWLEREAERRGVEVDESAVRRSWRATVRNQFPTRKALRRFLGRQTEEDVLGQLRVQALSEAIERDVRANADGDPAKAVEEYRERFQRESRKATNCRDDLEAPGCSDP